MKHQLLLTFFALSGLALFSSCAGSKHLFDAQAHRGGRGLMPENTIFSQMNAIRYNTTMEMDLQMSKDKKIVVSHEAFFDPSYCLTPEGETMTKADGRSRLIYDMPYDSVRLYNTGSKPYPLFPRQEKMPAFKPLLSDLLDIVEPYGKAGGHVNHYNIELKTSPSADGKHYPSLEEYVDSAMNIIMRKGIAKRTMIQSFDVRALQIVHRKWPKMEISYLVGATDKQDVQGYVKDLGFKPDIFSPNFALCTPERIKAFHEAGIRVIPWTPNTLEDLQRLKDMGVDGIITDYPDLYSQLK